MTQHQDPNAVASAKTFLCMGECMVEFFADGDGVWRRGFAGDTLNTAWTMRAVLAAHHHVGFVSAIGTDDISNAMASFISDAGIGADRIQRDSSRTVGLYTIATDDEGERHFSYWRSASAARHLADDAGRLGDALVGADIIYLTGITAAILGETGRAHLVQVLGEARRGGAKIVYDSNHRPSLWGSVDQTRAFSAEMGRLGDILLPSWEDEVAIFGDADQTATLDRLESYGCREIVLTDGAGPVTTSLAGQRQEHVVSAPVTPVDTTGAGDSFSGSYVAARMAGADPAKAVSQAQSVARAVVSRRGALIPMADIRGAFSG